MSDEPLSNFRPQRRNANKHTPKGQRLLRDAIQANGWIGAITVAADGETFAGSQRLETVAEIGMDNPIVVDADGSRPVIIRRTDIASADDPRAVLLGIGDNQIAALDLEWDTAALSDALALVSTDMPSLAEMCDELAQQVGVAPGVEAGEDDPVQVDEDAPTRVQPGEVWRLGRHVVACLDSTDAAAVRRLTAGRRVAMVIADAPYGMNLDTNYSARPLSDKARAKHPTQNSHAPVIGDDKPFDPSPWFALFEGVQEQFWWGADYYRRHLPEGGSWLVWDKRVSVEDVEYSSSSFELCWSRAPHRRDILRVPWFGIIGMEQEGGKRVHPTQKPTRLYATLMEYGAVGDLILDPFLGSGPSLKAAESMGRSVIGFELSPAYCDHVIGWWEQTTGGVAERS